MLQNEEAFEDGMNEKIVETEEAVEHGIEKAGVEIIRMLRMQLTLGILRKHWKTR